MGVWSYNYLSSGILAAKYLAESVQSIMIEEMGTGAAPRFVLSCGIGGWGGLLLRGITDNIYEVFFQNPF